jgi:hypothetical protein
MTLVICATEGMQDGVRATLQEAILDPAVDTPPKRSLSSTAKAIHFLAICRTFLSGGTRIRTGDTMIFSPPGLGPAYASLSGNLAWLCDFRVSVGSVCPLHPCLYRPGCSIGCSTTRSEEMLAATADVDLDSVCHHSKLLGWGRHLRPRLSPQ